MPYSSLAEKIRTRAVPGTLPDGSPFISLSVDTIGELADAFGIGIAQVETTALGEGILPMRYARNMKSLTFEDQVRLLESKVTVIGLGGLGGAVCEGLARIGIGNLTLIDGDRFEDSNLNRQFLCTEKTRLQSKAEMAAKRVMAVNKAVRADAHHVMLDETNAATLIRGSDVAVDCLDNIRTRLIVEGASRREGLPLVSGAVAGTSGQVMTIFPSDKGFQPIYGSAENGPKVGAEASLGCLPQAIMMIASVECSEVIKILLGKKGLLRNKLLFVDLMENTFNIFSFS